MLARRAVSSVFRSQWSAPVSSLTARCLSSASAAGGGGAGEMKSFARALFLGEVPSSMLDPYPVVLSEGEEEMLRAFVDPVASFFENENDDMENDRTASIPPEIVSQLAEMGAFGLQVPEALGGVGLSNTGYARMVEIVGKHDLGVGITLGASQSIGYKGILLFGNDTQKEKYLPKLASGEHIAAFALTEPGAGSDAAGIKTRAEKQADGSWVLNGEKLWISNGGDAQIMTVFARTKVVDASGEEKDKISAFIVDRDFGGVSSGPPERKLGIKCSQTCAVTFEDTKIPAENLLGEEGQGFKIAMEILNNGRFGMGAALTGMMKRCIAGVTEHAMQRKQFGQTLAEFEAIRGKVADMSALCYATESLAYLVAGTMDRGATDYSIEAAASKVFASEAATHIADETVLLFGGLGFMEELPWARLVRDTRIFRIFEGANPILRLFIALSGIKTVGDDLKVLQAALKDPVANLGVLAPAAVDMAKSKLGMYDKPSLSWAPAVLRPAAAVVEDNAGAFAANVKELVMQHKKGIIQEQVLLTRVGDAVIDLVALSATLSRAAQAHKDGAPTADQQVALANLFAQNASHRIAHNISGLADAKAEDAARTAVAEILFEQQADPVPTPLGF